MFKKISVSATPLTFKDLKNAFFPKRDAIEDFEIKLRKLIGAKYSFLTNSGVSSFFLVLGSLKKLYPKRFEVILPAYTAPILAVAILKAGLKPILVDITLKDFSFDIELLEKAVSEYTLCIVAVHMFGIPSPNITFLRDRFKDIFIVEDCAQALGSEINKRPVGIFGDVGFFSFNRGKNLPTYGGGLIITNLEKIAEVIKEKIDSLKENNTFFETLIAFKIFLFSLAVRPIIYGGFFPIFYPFKSNSIPQDFKLKRYSNCQASTGLSLLENLDQLIDARYYNGMFMARSLRGLKKLKIPLIGENIKPAFNRFPIMFEDLKLKEDIKNKLFFEGVETSDLYKKPIHHYFDIGYQKEDFPVANCMAEGLLTLPTHSLLDKRSLLKIVDIIKKNAI